MRSEFLRRLGKLESSEDGGREVRVVYKNEGEGDYYLDSKLTALASSSDIEAWRKDKSLLFIIVEYFKMPAGEHG